MSSSITEINKDTFWMLIDRAKEHSGGPSEWLMEQLVSMGPEQAKKFDTIAHAYMDAAYQYGLWTAASVIERYGCSDDGFIDFRAWLVGQGKDVYMAALKDPDSLVNVPSYQNSLFDSLPYFSHQRLRVGTLRKFSGHARRQPDYRPEGPAGKLDQ